MFSDESFSRHRSDGADGVQCALIEGDAARESANSISNFETIIHLLKGNIGMGVLTLPMAIRNSGLMFGSFGLAFIAFVCVYCMRMLVNAAHKACARVAIHLAFSPRKRPRKRPQDCFVKRTPV